MEKLKRNSYQIKLFMAFLMVFDHLPLTGLVPLELKLIFHVLTRVVGVWFAYGAVEGFLYTRNSQKYIFRLFSWAFIMFAGNTFFNYLYRQKEISVQNNIFLTLAMGVLLLYCLKNINNQILKWFSFSVVLVISLMFTEGGSTVIPFMLITYFTYGKNKHRNIGYTILSVVLFVISFNDYGDITQTLQMLAFNSDFLFILILPFLYLYDGTRGKDTKFAKYFFYVFYPLHLWVLATIGWFLA